MEKTTAEKISEFTEQKDRIGAMGGEKMVQKQREQGKWTARERLDLLFDRASFEEIQLFVKHRSTHFGLGDKEINADGVVTGFGKISGRVVFAASQDFTSAGGSLGEMHAQKNMERA
jgi:methylmalonyl-CoA decarboxylase subunit alpha